MSDSALAARLADLRAARRTALIPYITAGYPGPDETTAFLRGAAAAGADAVELGVPWSDPVADGPTIQASTHAALQQGTTLARTLALLAGARADVPVVVFTYLNPVLAHGAARFAADAKRAGAAGLLVTDLPVGADDAVERDLLSAGLPLVRLVAPTTPPRRRRAIAEGSQGFLYLIARLGVTGESGALSSVLGEQVAALRAVSDLPIAVGFGISSPEQAAAVAAYADGVVIGSAVVSRMGRGGAAEALGWLRTVRAALDARRAGA
ncbi:MAG TPA: tryptophan synthase subunit alpha [Gemmatimonadales bacterium]|nr:tryptophan synthase subunit alpha [Gemmatimonadales bacterium]